MRNSVILFVLVAIVATGLAVPSEAQISIGGAILTETEKMPVAMNLIMAIHVVDAGDEAYGPESASRLLRAPLAAVASSAMAGPAGKPANVPAYFRLTGQGVQNLISLDVSFNGVDFAPASYEGPEDGFIGVVPRLRPGLYTPIGRLVHKDGRKERAILFFIRSGKQVEGQVTAAFQLLVTNPVSGIEGMGTREIASLCSNMVPADGPQPVPVLAAPVAAAPAPDPVSPPVVVQERVESVEKEAPSLNSTISITLLDRVSGEWPRVILRTPTGKQEFVPDEGGNIFIQDATPGQYSVIGVAGRVSYETVPFTDPNSKELGESGSVAWTLRSSN